MAGTASGRTVFVLGKELYGNRQVVVFNDGEEYGMYDNTAVQDYVTGIPNTRFPYDM